MEPYIDPHIHMTDLGWDALEFLGISGMAAAVSPVARPDVIIKKRTGVFDADDLMQYWDHALWLAERLEKTFFYRVFLAISWGSNSRVEGVDRLYRALMEYRRHGRVVAVGELGLDPYKWATTVFTEESEAIISEQLALAKELDAPVILHTPMWKSPVHYIEGPRLPDGASPWPFKVSTAQRTFSLVDRVGLDHRRVVIDHADGDLIPWALKHTSAYVAISGANYWRDISPRQAAAWVREFGSERLMVDSDAHPHFSMDPFWVARTIREMRRAGLEPDIIRRVVYENPMRFYNLSL